MNAITVVVDFLEGKKTYIVAFLAASIALAQAVWPTFTVPEYVYLALGAAGLGAVRASIPPKP
jgi:hypothetical protein